jgi:SAM-dependent methyltransferase
MNGPLSSASYDGQWRRLGDFVVHHPGGRHRRRIALEFLSGLRFASVLEVGCGPGAMLVSIRDRFPHVSRLCGADFAEETIRANRIAMPWAEFHRLDIEHGALDATFDLVLCTEVIEHLGDRQTAFRHLSSMVAPGGYLLITCPTGRVFATEAAFGHLSHPSRDELLTLGSANGLRTVRQANWGFPAYTLVKHATNLHAEFALRHFASGSYSPLKKALSLILYWLCFLTFGDHPLGCQFFWLYHKPAGQIDTGSAA